MVEGLVNITFPEREKVPKGPMLVTPDRIFHNIR
jgi:hypothetical protein